MGVFLNGLVIGVLAVIDLFIYESKIKLCNISVSYILKYLKYTYKNNGEKSLRSHSN